ncbi:RmlC-like cupin domain-containing protein, partial [Clohesyomyces aquaticus]
SFSTVVVASATPSGVASGIPSATPSAAPVQDTKALFKELVGLSTQLQRLQKTLTDGAGKLLSGDALRKLVVFDFNGGSPAPGAKGGITKAANIETFPLITALGAGSEEFKLSTTVAFLNACGINTPHVHPRANEFLTVTEGTVDFGFIAENALVKEGSPEVTGRLEKFQATIFPKGSVHYQFNPTCKPATFIATLDNKDAGTLTMAQAFYGLNAGVVNATLGFPKTLDGKDIETFRKQIPANLAQDIDNCLAKC